MIKNIGNKPKLITKHRAQLSGSVCYRSPDAVQTMALYMLVKQHLETVADPDKAKAAGIENLQTILKFGPNLAFLGDFIKSVSDITTYVYPDGERVNEFTINFN